MNRFRLLALCALPIITGPALATTYAVGSGTGCTHSSFSGALAAAVADASAGPHWIKLDSGQRTVSNYEITNPQQDITIEGGYAQCSDTAPTSGQRSTLNNTTASGARVLSMSNSISAARRTITLRKVTISGGRNPAGLGGGGIFATGKLTLLLQNETIIEDNIASNGGGISLVTLNADPDNFTRLRLQSGSAIEDNQATGGGANGYGGGIDCIGGCYVTLWDGSVGFNSARRGGGAIALRSNLALMDINPAVGSEVVLIGNNSAGTATFSASEGYGGAIYSDGGRISATLFGDGNDYGVWLFNNTANYGGAIYAVGPTSGTRALVSLDNAFVYNNMAKSRGGAFYSLNGVDWTVDHDSVGDCPTFGGRQPCSFFSDNQAETTEGGVGAGVVYLTAETGSQGGVINIYRTLFEGNTDVAGVAAIAEALNGSWLNIRRSVFRNNSANGPATQRTLFGSTDSDMYFHYNSVLANDVAGIFYMNGGTLRPQGSILWDPGATIWFQTGGASMSMVTTCLVSHSTTGLSFPPGSVWVEDPLLDGRYAPAGGSSALDHCSNSLDAGPDLYGHSPAVDVASVPNRIGSNDLGAVEQTDIIHYSGFGNRPTN